MAIPDIFLEYLHVRRMDAHNGNSATASQQDTKKNKCL